MSHVILRIPPVCITYLLMKRRNSVSHKESTPQRAPHRTNVHNIWRAQKHILRDQATAHSCLPCLYGHLRIYFLLIGICVYSGMDHDSKPVDFLLLHPKIKRGDISTGLLPVESLHELTIMQAQLTLNSLVLVLKTPLKRRRGFATELGPCLNSWCIIGPSSHYPQN